MSNRPGQKIRIDGFDAMFGVSNEETAMDIEIYKIYGFAGHPFKVIDDEKMIELVESIKANNILSPVLVRPKKNDTYEMISGHRRLHAAKIAGLKSIPAIIRELSDDEATIAMVDANIQREELLPSERAYAFKMKMDAMNRQGSRQDLTSRQNVEKLSSEKIGEESNMSGRQVQRFIRLTELIPELLELVDTKKLNFTVAVDVSYIDKEIQEWLNEYICDNGTIKANQISELRKAIAIGPVTREDVIMILDNVKQNKKVSGKFNISEKELRGYFPPEYSGDDMKAVILELLKRWKNENE